MRILSVHTRSYTMDMHCWQPTLWGATTCFKQWQAAMYLCILSPTGLSNVSPRMKSLAVLRAAQVDYCCRVAAANLGTSGWDGPPSHWMHLSPTLLGGDIATVMPSAMIRLKFLYVNEHRSYSWVDKQIIWHEISSCLGSDSKSSFCNRARSSMNWRFLSCSL